jgi:hypothetical protein
MTAPALDLSERDVLTVLRTVLLSVLADNVEVILTEINRVPEPAGDDFVLMTPVTRPRLGTNIAIYTDGFPDAPSTVGVRQATQIGIQLDVHGPNSATTTQTITTLSRSMVWCDAFRAVRDGIAPLYADDPRQSVFVNQEGQMEVRWTIDLMLQANPTVTLAQEFFSTATVVPQSVAAIFPVE